jgi:hypothetical protein
LESFEDKPTIVEETLDLNHVPSQVLELDLHIRPVGTASGHMALLGDEEEQVATGGSGFLEKNLSDFFDIQIFSTVYFGSRNEPHQLIFDTGSSWLWV